MDANKKLIVVLGPNAAGKSALAVSLARKFNGEIVSADSRQVYRGMNLGTGKITPDTRVKLCTGQAKKKYIFTHKGIPHYCIDIASPKKRFDVIQYRKLAQKAINRILKNDKTPILCGGTGFYIQAVVDGLIMPAVKPDWRLRLRLDQLSCGNLFDKLKRLDPKRASTIDKKNKRRLVRALEIVMKSGKPVASLKKNPPPYPVLIIGVKKSTEELKELILRRLYRRLKSGMVKEVEKLHKTGLSWKRLEEFGLEYRYIAQYLQKKISYGEMLQRLQKETEHFAKRQMTWFKRDRRIQWVKNYREAEKLVNNFLNKLKPAKLRER